MSIKLSLKQNQTAGKNMWIESGKNPYTHKEINEVDDNINIIDAPVTSIPSPFARLHLFETAFTWMNDHFQKKPNASTLVGKSIYHQLVSDCLDVFEILFRYDELQLRGRVKIVNWEINQTKALQEHHKDGIKVLGSVLKLYISGYNEDLRFKQNGIEDPFNRFSIILIDNKLVAGTSPYTGFFTTSNKINCKVKNIEGRYYFSSPKALHERNNEFQKFLNLFFEAHPKLLEAFNPVRNYIVNSRLFIEDRKVKRYIDDIDSIDAAVELQNNYESLYINNNNLSVIPGITFKYKKIDVGDIENEIKNSDFIIRTKKTLKKPPLALKNGIENNWTYIRNPITSDIIIPSSFTENYDDRPVPGFENLQYPVMVLNDVLSRYLVKLEDYEINDKKFWTGPNPKIKNVLLPIKPDYFRFFTIQDLKENLEMDFLEETGAIVVTLKIPIQADNKNGYIEFQRTYNDVSLESINENDDSKGAIVSTRMYLGIYPFYKVNNNLYNDLYKISLFYPSGNAIDCNFYQDITNKADLNVVSISNTTVRTRPEEGTDVVSKYYEINKFGDEDVKDIRFDYIGLNLQLFDQYSAEGIIIPEMDEEINLRQSETSIAFDIGTSNTYAAVQLGNNISELTISDELGKKLQYTMLHMPQLNEEALTGSARYDLNYITGPDCVSLQYCEFIPSLIGKKSVFKFPVRTIINQDNDVDASLRESVRSLSNVNIPFAFSAGTDNLRSDLDIAYSNLKWGVNKPEANREKNRLRAFIEQMMLMGRNKILSEGYLPSKSKVVWFKPLSMSTGQVTVFEEVWDELYQKYFSKTPTSEDNLKVFTESWAPFYSYDRTFGAGYCFVNIDIGGGTSDLLIFKDKKPILTTSFRFAGNSLFDNGVVSELNPQSENDKDNGFVLKYCDTMEDLFKEKESWEKISIMDFIKRSDGLRSEDLISFFFTLPEFVEKLKTDNQFRLLFLIHNAALFFHSAQVLKGADVDEIPSLVGLCGNGSRLLEITNLNNKLNRTKGIGTMVNFIFNYVLHSKDKFYEIDDSNRIELQILENPKEATSIGGLKGLKQMDKDQNLDTENYYIPLGDANTLVKENDVNQMNQYRYNDLKEKGNPKIEDVVNNYLEFIDFFFGKLWDHCDFKNNFEIDRRFNPEKLKAYFGDRRKVESILHEVLLNKTDVEQEEKINETLFFYPLKGFLYDCSKILSSESGINRFSL